MMERPDFIKWAEILEKDVGLDIKKSQRLSIAQHLEVIFNRGGKQQAEAMIMYLGGTLPEKKQ